MTMIMGKLPAKMGTGWENPTIGATLGAGQPVSWSDSLTNF